MRLGRMCFSAKRFLLCLGLLFADTVLLGLDSLTAHYDNVVERRIP